MRCLFAATAVVALAAGVTTACADVPCKGVPEWIIHAPVPDTQTPPSHTAGGDDCPFYKDSWQNFLLALEGPPRQPRFLNGTDYLTISQLFATNIAAVFPSSRKGMLSLAIRTVQLPNDASQLLRARLPGVNAGINQAGDARGVLIDKNGNPLYYAIHVSRSYKDFLDSHRLTTHEALIQADPDAVEFSDPGIVELKSAWQIVEPGMDTDDYVVADAEVPTLMVANGSIAADATHPRSVKVRLLAIHVVFTIQKHPEFVWSSFEHVNAAGQRDNAPAASQNPTFFDSSQPVDATDGWSLYKGGRLASQCNIVRDQKALVQAFDPGAQKFSNADVSTCVYRMYPSSKTAANDEGTPPEDAQVGDINASMRQIFEDAGKFPLDPRSHYSLVGATWLDDPSHFSSKQLFGNSPDKDSDSGPVAGEDSLSSTSMESFTQVEQRGCFSCHNTLKVTDDRDGHKILDPKRLNVSHILSRFLSVGQ